MKAQRKVYRILNGWLGQPWRRRILLIEAAFALHLARILILLVPFPWISKRFGSMRHPDPESVSTSAPRGNVAEIAWAIDRVATYSPLELVCLPRAIAARAMLRRRGVHGEMFFGAGRGEAGGFNTHAWCVAGGQQVTGFPEAHDCTPLGFFAW